MKFLKTKNKYTGLQSDGQAVMEFTFCVIVLLLLVYGSIAAFRWSGVTLANRRVVHDQTLYGGIDEGWDPPNYEAGALGQLKLDFYKAPSMNLVFNNWP